MNDDVALVRLGRRIRRARREAKSAALESCIRPVDASLRYGTHPGKRFWADCYRRACDYVLEHSRRGGPFPPVAGMRLVHGVCREGDLVLAHAWVDLPGDLVFDGVRQEFYDRSCYRHVMQNTDEARYSAAAMVEQMRATRRYGPWHAGVLGHDAVRRLPAATAA